MVKLERGLVRRRGTIVAGLPDPVANPPAPGGQAISRDWHYTRQLLARCEKLDHYRLDRNRSALDNPVSYGCETLAYLA